MLTVAQSPQILILLCPEYASVTLLHLPQLVRQIWWPDTGT